MIKRIVRFYDPSTLTFVSAKFYHKDKAPTSYSNASDFTDVEESVAMSHPLVTKFMKYISDQFQVQERMGNTPLHNLAWKGWALNQGTITSKKFDDESCKTHLSNHPGFELRQKLGEIIVSDYTHSRARAVYSDGVVQTHSKVYRTDTFTLTACATGSAAWKQLANECGYTQWSTSGSAPPSWMMVKVAPNLWMSVTVSLVMMEYTYDIGHNPLDYGFSYAPFRALISANEAYNIEDQIPIDGAIVTSVVAKANKGDADILTFLSELPMSIATTLAGLAKVGEMSKDLRTLDIKKSRISRSLLQKWKRKHWETLKKRVPKKRGPDEIFRRYEAVATALAGELLDATALVNLWWRYDLRPNLYSLDDHIKHMESMITDEGRRSYREKVVVPYEMPVMPGFTWQGEATTTYRYTCIRHYYTSDWLSKVKRSLTTDKSVTLWELLWGSFMVDWFLNIGDVLAAMPTRDPLLKCDEGFTVSRNTVISGSYIMDENPTIRATLTIDEYKRAKISPEKYLGFYYRNKMDLWKLFDMACIAWGLSRPKLRKNPIFTFL